MITQLNHIAIVVNDLDLSLQAYHELLGLPIGARKVMAEQEVEIAFLPAGDSLEEVVLKSADGAQIDIPFDAQGGLLCSIGEVF